MRRCWRRRRCLCLARLQCLISSSHLQGLVHCHLNCWTVETNIQMTLQQFTNKRFYLKLPFVCYSTFVAYFVNTNKYLLLVNPLNPELNPICYLLALLGAHHFLHVSRIRVKSITLRLLMSYIYIYIYIYGAPILDVSRSHTTTQHSR